MKVSSHNPTEAYVQGQTTALFDNTRTNLDRCLTKLLEAYENESKKGIDLYHKKWEEAHAKFMSLFTHE